MRLSLVLIEDSHILERLLHHFGVNLFFEQLDRVIESINEKLGVFRDLV